MTLVYGFMPSEVGTIFVPELDISILAFSAVLAIGTGLLFGVFPALQSTRLNLVTMLKGQSGQSSGGRSAARFRTSLATVQVALSMALLVAAGLFVRSLYNVSRVDLGVNIDRVVTFSLSPGLNGYSAERSQQLFEEIERQLKTFPGVRAVSSGTIQSLAGATPRTTSLWRDSEPAPTPTRPQATTPWARITCIPSRYPSSSAAISPRAT